jgi:hypothetical protein
MFLVAYNRTQVIALVRTATPQQIRSELRTGRRGQRLTLQQREELDTILMAWEQRALGAMPLRDALLVDRQRGPRAYALLCADLSVQRVPVPPLLPAQATLTAGDLPALPSVLRGDALLLSVAQQAQQAGLALALQRAPEEFALPPELDALLPPELPPYTPQEFAPPQGRRRTLALILACTGMLLLAIPLSFGQIPDHPAGLPLALITLALLVGIRAGKAGYIGSLCIWLVAQLPSFRHDTSASLLWPAIPLLLAGVLLLSVDRRVRMMWAWIRQQFRKSLIKS